MQVIKASQEVAEEIKEMLNKNDIHAANLRIVARFDEDGGKIAEGFKLFQSEITLNDQIQEFDGFNIIVSNILVRLYGGFTLTCTELNGKSEVEITPDKKEKPTIYRGAALGTVAK